MRSPSRLALLAILLGVTALDAAEGVPLVEGPAPAYPAALAGESVNRGHALVVCAIEDDGAVADTWVLEASHVAFASASEETLRTWRYAALAGEAAAAPWPRLEVVRCEYSRSGQITTRTQREAMAAAFPAERGVSARGDAVPFVPAASLTRVSGDAPSPVPGPAGTVLVEFLVDREGRVRLPVALRAQDGEQARAAVRAARAWRFDPPQGGAPAVRLRWLFRFPARG